MADQRSTALVIAFSPTFKKQTTFGTALANAELTAAFPVTARNYFEVNETVERILDCTGQRLIDELLTGRIGALTLEFDATPQLLFGLYALAYGVVAAPSGAGPFTHEGTQLPLDVYQPPPTSFIVGFKGSARALVILKDAVVNNVRVRATARGKVTATATISFNGAVPAAVAFTLPACASVTPVRMSDCQLLVNAIDQTALLREFEHSYSNNLLLGDDPYTGNSIDPTRLERADERAETLNFQILGEPGDAMHVDMVARTKRSVLLHIGAATNRMSINATEAIIKRQGSGIGFDGEARRSTLRVTAEPVSVAGAAPSRITGINTQATAYLIAA
ncbi:MAG: hypothetical protein M3458_05305 [Acidobacteriota bacterium]|nr:hypothetical protein [Acidobacteriota bacterium]